MSDNTNALADARILVVDDDPDILTAARLLLRRSVGTLDIARAAEGLAERLSSERWDVVLLDMNLTQGKTDGADGFAWLERLKAADPAVSVVLMTAFGGVAVAVEAMKRGASDFVLKPWANERLVATVMAGVSLARSRREADDLRIRHQALSASPSIDGAAIIGGAGSMRRVFEVIGRAAPTNANVLVLGESGTGKELVAREIHRLSSRANGPFVSIDLGAVSENLFESELFGHRKGAFTDARDDRPGRIVAASGGTLFLDEIGNLPLYLQRKLLTVLERQEVVPVGGDRMVSVDIRVVSATNVPTAELQREQVFRQDLLYRVNTVELTLPPLRDRREDIAALAEHFIAIYARKYNVARRRRLSGEALALLESYRWPGNVRELKHAIERATILATGDRFEPQDFPAVAVVAPIPAGPAAAAELGPDLYDLDAIERRTIARALADHTGNISRAASVLGLTRAALYRRMEKHGL
jgi:DNA-binding NtrC family response regulator